MEFDYAEFLEGAKVAFETGAMTWHLVENFILQIQFCTSRASVLKVKP